MHQLPCNYIHNSTLKTKALHNMLLRTNVSVIFLQHVSARLGHHQGKSVERKVYIT
jgi:hypothetical protein